MLLVFAILRVYKLSIRIFYRNDTNQNAQGTKKKSKETHLSLQYICKCNQKCMRSARTQTNIRVTSSAVIFICEKSVQGRRKLIQFRFVCNRTVWVLYPPILQQSSSLFTDVKLIHLQRTTKKIAVCVSTS